VSSDYKADWGRETVRKDGNELKKEWIRRVGETAGTDRNGESENRRSGETADGWRVGIGDASS